MDGQRVRALEGERYSILSNQEMGSASYYPSFRALRGQQLGRHRCRSASMHGDIGRKVGISGPALSVAGEQKDLVQITRRYEGKECSAFISSGGLGENFATDSHIQDRESKIESRAKSLDG